MNPESETAERFGIRSLDIQLLRLRLACNGLEALARSSQWTKAEQQEASGIAEFLALALPKILRAHEKLFRRYVQDGRLRETALALILEDHKRLLSLAKTVAAALSAGSKSAARVDPAARRDQITRYIAAQRYYLSNAVSLIRDEAV